MKIAAIKDIQNIKRKQKNFSNAVRQIAIALKRILDGSIFSTLHMSNTEILMIYTYLFYIENSLRGQKSLSHIY